MMTRLKQLFVSLFFTISLLNFGMLFSAQPAYAAIGEPCTGGSFLGLPSWYKYLDSEEGGTGLTGTATCDVKIDGISDVWLIVAAVLEIMLRVAAFAAVCFIIYGGVLYILSQSQPDKTAQALKTVISALVGLVIAIVASALVAFIAGRFN